MSNRVVQIRAYTLKPGRAAAFERLFVDAALPLLHDAGIDVVAFGPSPHEADAWYLIRAFDDLARLTADEDAFYGSDAWLRGPREAILDTIERYLDTVLSLSPPAIDDLRASNGVIRGSPAGPA